MSAGQRGVHAHSRVAAMSHPDPNRSRETARRNRQLGAGYRTVPEETPIALSYGGSTHAVMMATPADLEDFAVGFSLTEGIIADRRRDRTDRGRRRATRASICRSGSRTADRGAGVGAAAWPGPVGCGLCGIELIEQAVRRPPTSAGRRLRFTPARSSRRCAAAHAAAAACRDARRACAPASTCRARG